MPRAKAPALLAGLVGSDTEPDFDDFDTFEIQAARDRQSMSVTKKPRGRPLALSKVAKSTPAAGRPRGRPTAKTILETPRESIAETRTSTAFRTTRQASKQIQDNAIESDALVDPPVAASAQAKRTRGRPKAVGSAVKKDIANKGTGSVPASATRSRGRPSRLRQAATPPEEIPETQHEEREAPEEVESMDVDTPTQDPEPSQITTDPIENAGMYDTSDVSLRRRLGDLTKKYENLDTRHRNLRDVGVKEAERNFDRLRKQAEERTAAATKLIAELKQELAAQTALAREGEELRKQLEESDARVNSLETEVEALNASLSQSRTEAKTLSTKLGAFRSGEANARVPGSALKPKSAAGLTAAQFEAAHAAQHAAQAKEDLYGDLTGLILRGLKREEMEDVFDCIQTGRNGTLHFKLAVESADQADGYDDVRFTYRPQLDPDRDGELMDMLPDYLVEEITFPRPQASKFYARVIKSLTERLEYES